MSEMAVGMLITCALLWVAAVLFQALVIMFIAWVVLRTYKAGVFYKLTLEKDLKKRCRWEGKTEIER